MSNPQEKAKELVEKFRLNVLDYEGCSINEHKAKQCAIIATNEILNNKIGGLRYNSDKQFWKDVKKEIKKL
jgi:hypothetical protein